MAGAQAGDRRDLSGMAGRDGLGVLRCLGEKIKYGGLGVDMVVVVVVE